MCAVHYRLFKQACSDMDEYYIIVSWHARPTPELRGFPPHLSRKFMYV